MCKYCNFIRFLKGNFKTLSKDEFQEKHVTYTHSCFSVYSHIQYVSWLHVRAAQEEFVITFCLRLQASEHLRKLCMQNMVWSYCKKISPEWKLQVNIVPSAVKIRSLWSFRCLVCCVFPFLHCNQIWSYRWSRRWRPAKSSRTRRTTTRRACLNCLSTQDSVRLKLFYCCNKDFAQASSCTLREFNSV